MKKRDKDLLKFSERRNAIINALNSALDIFTSHSEKDFENVINKGLKPIADAVGLDRIVFYRGFDIDGEKRFGQMYRWDKAKGGLISIEEKLKILPKIPLFAQWLSILSRDECIKIRESDMSTDELVFMREYGIKSIILIPIFSHGDFWGTVSLQNHTNDSYFDEGCLDLLFSVARMCANSIIRAETSNSASKVFDALKRREKMTSMLNKMAVTFLSHIQESFETMMTEGIGLIADVMDLDRVSIWRNIDKSDGLHSSQIYRWDRESGGTTIPTAVFADVTYSQLAPRWETILSGGQTINSPVRLLPKSEAGLLKEYGVVSVFIAPVFLNNDFWGFVLFEDRQKERFFENDLTETMLSAAFLCANTVIRADMEKKITNVNTFNRATIDSAPIGFTIFDENMNIIDTNNACLDIFGCDKDYYVNNFFKFLPEFQPNGDNSREKILEVVKRTLNGENFKIEFMHQSPSGKIIPFEITMARTKYMGKHVALCYQYDLQHIKKITEELKKQGKQLKERLEQQVLVSEISRGFISSGEMKNLINEAIAKLGNYFNVSRVSIFCLDYKSGDANMAYNWSAENSPERLGKFSINNFIKESFPERLYDTVTVPIISCPDTSSSRYDTFRDMFDNNVGAFICAPLYVEGLVWGLLTVDQCYNPRRWTDNEKNFIAMTSSTIAGAIMLDIYNTKLKDAVTKVTAASKAKSEFLSNMSHEIRTPMNAIINMTVIGKSTSDLDRKNYALDKIGNASNHLLGIINDILDMSKIEAKKYSLVPVEFDFEEMIERVVSVVNFRVEEKHQKLVVQTDNNIPKVLIGDDQRISQVITNLLGNAVKFTPENGSIFLNSQFLGEENGSCKIQISVVDTGIGISKEQQKKLFQSFQQAESSTARNYGGTGLGLSISKNFVEMMGGNIWIDSEYGKGSTFAFTIKVQRSNKTGEKRLKQDPLKKDNDDFSGHRILLVEDMEINREIVMMLLESTRLEIDCAVNGVQAVEMFIEEPTRYELIFMDVHMPGMDGYEATQQIREYEEKLRMKGNNTIKRIPIIAMTANVFKEDVDNCINAGMDDHLGKPIDIEMAMKKLRQYILR